MGHCDGGIPRVQELRPRQGPAERTRTLLAELLADQVPSSSGAEQSRVERLVSIHHTAHIEALERRCLDRRPIQPIQ